MPIPNEALEHHVAIVGKTGSGKSYAAQGIVEILIDQKQRVCIIDPTDRYWGLRLRSDGKKPSRFEPVIFGGQFADMPLSAAHGAARHNPMATIASRGCPVGCWFCIVPKMEGESFTLLPDFPVRPVLCDNNLSALPPEYQDHIVARYQREGVPLLDANSGFEPRTFDEEVFARWRQINRGPWRFAYDDLPEREHVKRVMRMLRGAGISPRRIQVYTLIGNENVRSLQAADRRGRGLGRRALCPAGHEAERAGEAADRAQ
jgi:energy-coupling factor transporter ATP-binding protein EcfA2